MFGNAKKTFFKSRMRKSLAVLLSMAMVLTMFPMTVMAASNSDPVQIQLVGKDGTVVTLDTWKYSAADKTYIDQKTGGEVSVIKDFTKAENLKGTAFGQSYDFTAVGALPYTGINMKPTDNRALSVTNKGILLEDLYDYAEGLAGGTDLRGDTAMYLSDASNFNDEFTYDQYWGLTRYYNPQWYDTESRADAKAENGSVVPGTLAVIGFHSTKFKDKTYTSSIPELITKSDELNALRITVGMQEDGKTEIADSWVKSGNNGGRGDLNEGNLSVSKINTIRFTPVYRNITVADGVISGTEGSDGYKYSVSNASVTASDNYFKAAKGETVTLTVAPDENYKVKTVIASADGKDIAVTAGADNTYSFEMPAAEVSVSVETAEGSDEPELPVLNADTSWYNTESKEFTVNTAEQLAGLAAIVNGTANGIAKDDFAGKTVKLGGNIAIDEDGKYTSAEGIFGKDKYVMTATYYKIDKSKSPVIWTPIGSGEATSNTDAAGNVFAGTFDGCGYTVSGIYTGAAEFTDTVGNTATVQGLFGIVSGKVKNVTVSGCITGKIVVGGIVAHLDGGTVENCVNKAIVYADGGEAPNSGIENGVSKAGAVGGITGYAKDESTVKNCINNADITCTNTAKGGRCGGIIGLVESNDTVAIEKNGNTGNINSYQYAGGIIGMNASKTSPINACYNTGKIVGNTGGSCYIGGIVSTCYSDIANCYNYGEYKVIYSGKAAHFGGIVSDFFGAKIENCYNTGMRSYTGDSNSSNGAICGTGYGTSDANKLLNCYALEGTAGEDIDNGCVTVKSADEMKSADFVKLLNGEGNAWTKGTEYPALKWQRTLESISVEIPGSVFTEGQTINKDSIIVTASYSNGVTERVTDFDYDKKEALTEGDTQLTVTYTEDGVEKTATAAISVLKASDLAWCDTDKTELTINTAGELRAFAAIVKGDIVAGVRYNFAGITVKLGADIDVSGKEWNPIGDADNAFAGTFDGQGHTVSGLTITTGEGGYKGLFGNNAGTVKNFTVSGNIGTEETPIASGFDNIGGAVGYNNGTVSGVKGNVSIDIGSTSGIYAIGGIVGQNGENGTVTECSNEAQIVGTKGVGGIVGRSYGAVSKCVNTGNISGCRGGNHGKDGIGGIVGLGGNKSGTYTNTVTSCYNRGDVSNDNGKWAGGIVGMTDSAATVSNCYSTGKIVGVGQANPIIGQSEGTALYNYFLDMTVMTDADGVYDRGGTKEGNEAKTEAEMKSADFVTLLNSKAADTWKAGNSKTNDGYAVLSWQPLNSTGGGSGLGGGSSSGGGGGAATTVQKPTITAGEGGKTSLSSDGTTLTITPDTGYEISKVTLNGTDKGAVGSLTGLKTGDKVTVEFVKKAETPAASSFNDVKDSDWFIDSVKYVSDNGLMTGTGAGIFSPNASTTRGMLMTILARKSGVDTTGSSPWYHKGLDWAVKNGVSDGTNPDNAITREQLASMLYRYAGSPQTSGDISKFSDAGSVSAYAQNALKWAVEKGIVTGKGNNTLAPGSNATRAEMAAMLQRYCKL